MAFCENVDFATFAAPENQAETPTAQGLCAAIGDAGLVYANNNQTTPKPRHLILAAQELRKYEAYQEERKPRGRNAKNSIKAIRAANKKTKGWERLSSDDRQRRVLEYAFQCESVAWTLNLTAKQVARLRTSDRPAKMLADAINRASKRLLGRAVPISIALEVTATGRLHAHGIATLESGEWKVFRKALKSAGGKVEGSGAGRQTDTRKLWSATGWASYIAKDLALTAKVLGTDKFFYQCNATRAGAREEYEASLHRQKEARRKTHRRPASAKKASVSLTHSPATGTRPRASMTQGGAAPSVNQYLLTKYLILFINSEFLRFTFGYKLPIHHTRNRTYEGSG